MNHASNPLPERLRELLAARALDDLSAEEERELDGLLASHESVDADEFDRVAAAVLLSLHPDPHEKMPQHLRERIAADAKRHLPTPPIAVPAGGAAPPTVQLVRESVGRREWFAWFAAAACLLVAATLWFTRSPDTADRASAVALREQLLSQAPDLVRAPWQPGKTPFDSPVTGDVVWSNSRQEGYLHFHGLPKNDAAREQYQLWIIDPARDDEPIDGGVFDISSTGDVVIPISPKLKVLDPTAFAITIEKPGGVVVSTQERLPVLAVVKG